MKNKMILIFFLSIFSFQAWGQSYQSSHSYRSYQTQGHQRSDQYDRYDSHITDHSEKGYGQVLRAEPVYQYVSREIPREYCSQRRVQNRGINGNSLFGAVVGGVVGNQFGSGSGQAAATALGAVIGANAFNGGATRYVDHCEVVYDRVGERQITHYLVTYRYKGKIYNTQMPYDPGARIYLEETVRPVYY